jgi:hypothetical protein
MVEDQGHEAPASELHTVCFQDGGCRRTSVAAMHARAGILLLIYCAQVETLAGQVMAVEVDAGASLAAMRAGIYQEVGIAAKQQRLIILGEPSSIILLSMEVFYWQSMAVSSSAHI